MVENIMVVFVHHDFSEVPSEPAKSHDWTNRRSIVPSRCAEEEIKLVKFRRKKKCFQTPCGTTAEEGRRGRASQEEFDTFLIPVYWCGGESERFRVT